MPSNYLENNLKKRFEKFEHFSRVDLLDFFRLQDSQINEGTFGWKIYNLKKKRIIESVKKGVYTLVRKKIFSPDLDKKLIKISNIVKGSLALQYNMWNTNWLNEFIELQSTTTLIILETDKDSMEAVFYLLKDKNMNVYFKPDENAIKRYLSEDKEAIVIKPMISRAPTNRIKKTVIPSPEKILVDLYCDEKLFFAYQGRQLVKIYNACFEKYIINLSGMLNYAKRRNREDEIKHFLLNNLPQNIKSLLE